MWIYPEKGILNLVFSYKKCLAKELNVLEI